MSKTVAEQFAPPAKRGGLLLPQPVNVPAAAELDRPTVEPIINGRANEILDLANTNLWR
jgi:hypothetical protein